MRKWHCLCSWMWARASVLHPTSWQGNPGGALGSSCNSQMCKEHCLHDIFAVVFQLLPTSAPPWYGQL